MSTAPDGPHHGYDVAGDDRGDSTIVVGDLLDDPRTDAEYNHVHRHSGIGWHTPASVHFGTASAVDQARQVTLNAAYAAHPERFARRPLPPRIPEQSWINQPQPELQNN